MKNEPIKFTPAAGCAMPYSEECESALLGGVLADETGGAVSIAQRAGVRAAAFYLPANTLLWEHVEAMAARREPISVHTLAVELEQTGKLAGIGGIPYLTHVSTNIPTSAFVRHYADELVLFWSRRHAIMLGTKLVEDTYGFSDRDDFNTACAELGRRLVTLGVRADTRTLGERIDAVADDVRARAYAEEDRSGWVFTGLKNFDERLRPLNSAREDQLTVVAGGSGEGKSALMRQWAAHALEQRMRVALFTRETTIEGTIEQMAASAVGLDLMNPDRALQETVEKYAKYCERMKDEWANRTLFCYEHAANQPLLTVEDLEARVRHHCFTHGVPHLVVVDYLQLFTTKRRMQSREQEVAHVSHQLQALAREVGGAWLLGCQMNEKGLSEMRTLRRERTADGKEGKVLHRIPNAGDLRESQAIYHDADRVLAIYRPPIDSREQDQTGPNIDKPEQWICQIKRRKGRTGIVKCWFEKMYTRFVELHVPAVSSSGPTSKAGWKGEKGGHT